MTKCAYCGSTIFLGGVRANGQRFCNKKCQQNAWVLSATQTIPAAALDLQVEHVWAGNCPKCGGPGPVDVHKFHQVWSALVLTRWTSHTQLSCRSCATKRQLGGAAFSLALGWWGFPWGLILTPVQITRNLFGIARGPSPAHASAELRKLVLANLGTQLLASQQPADQDLHLAN